MRSIPFSLAGATCRAASSHHYFASVQPPLAVRAAPLWRGGFPLWIAGITCFAIVPPPANPAGASGGGAGRDASNITLPLYNAARALRPVWPVFAVPAPRPGRMCDADGRAPSTLRRTRSIVEFFSSLPLPARPGVRQTGEMGSLPRQAGGFGRASCHLRPPVNNNALLPKLQSRPTIKKPSC